MDVWILRYPERRHRTGAPRKVIVLRRTEEGEETELETLEVEMRSAPLQDVAQAQIAKGRTRLVLDLIHEKHMDSSDLAQTLEAFKQAGALGAELVIANPNPKIKEIFRITHLDQVMGLFDSVDAAAEHFAS